MADADRVQANIGSDWSDILTDEVKELVASLQDEFSERIAGLREARLDMIATATQRGIQPGHLSPSDATTTEWSVPDMPDELWNPGIEISGPAHMTSMFINALNPGPEGERAEGDLDDDEDSASHILSDTLLAARQPQRRSRQIPKLLQPSTRSALHHPRWRNPIFHASRTRSALRRPRPPCRR